MQISSVIPNPGSSDTNHLSLTPTRSKSYTGGALVGKSVPHLSWSPRSAHWVCLEKKKVGGHIAKAPSDWKGLRITEKLIRQSRQAQIEAVISASV